MRRYRIGFTAVLAALWSAGAAVAAPCYIVIDRNDTAVYRDLTPPFDLSVANPPERDAMRKRGELLVIAEFENCRPVGYISPTTGATAASVDQIVMQLQPAISTSINRPGSYVSPPGVGVTGF